MANSHTSNKFHIDSTGSLTTKRQQISYILFTPNASGDTLALKETSAGDVVFTAKGAVAHATQYLDFSRRPLVFGNGVYVSTITSGATAVIVTTEAGK